MLVYDMHYWIVTRSFTVFKCYYCSSGGRTCCCGNDGRLVNVLTSISVTVHVAQDVQYFVSAHLSGELHLKVYMVRLF